MNIDHNDIIEINGQEYKITLSYDECMVAPWENSDGHGVVTDWTSRSKHPHEVVLNKDRGSFRYYDVKESIEIAHRDGWGLTPSDLVKLETKLGKKATNKQIKAEAVRLDCEYLRKWCNNDWHYLVVGVQKVVDGEPVGLVESVGGVESCDPDYIQDVVTELASQLN